MQKLSTKMRIGISKPSEQRKPKPMNFRTASSFEC